jgi:hypothetical protein
MSYGKFLDELESLFRSRREKNLPQQHYKKTFADLRDIWIKDGRYSELNAFISDNWDSGNGDDFVNPYSQHLIQNAEIGHFKKLWKGILRRRMNKMWSLYNFLKKVQPNVTLEEIKSQNLSDYNQYSSDESAIKSLSWQREYLLKGIDEYKQGLLLMNDESELDNLKKLNYSISNLIQPKPKPSYDNRKIDESLFWQLIEDSRSNSEDKYEFIERLSSKLEEFKPKEIINFEKIFSKMNEKLNISEIWALAYIIRKGCGDDEFDYFKAWVISKGKEVYKSIIEMQIEKIVDNIDEDPQFEELLYLSENVYESRTGEYMPPVKVKKNYIRRLNWTEETLVSDFPEICRIFEFDKNRLE